MRFEDERYVRVYTTDTATWKRLSWQARALLCLLLRKVNRVGVLDVDEEPAASVAAVVEVPGEVVGPALAELEARHVVTIRDGSLIFPRFLEAQECVRSPAMRARDYRERLRERALGVTKSDGPGATVTQTNAPSRTVTRRHSRAGAGAGAGARAENESPLASLGDTASPCAPSAIAGDGKETKPERGVAATPGLVVSEKPCPFQDVIDLWAMLHSKSGGRFAPVDGWDGSAISAVRAARKIHRDISTWETLAEYGAAGGIAFPPDPLGPSWLRSADLGARMGQALAWKAAGCPAVARKPAWEARGRPIVPQEPDPPYFKPYRADTNGHA